MHPREGAPQATHQTFPAADGVSSKANAHLWVWAARTQHTDLETCRTRMSKSKWWGVGGREEVQGALDQCLGGCMSQGAAAMVGVLYQHICRCMTVSAWTWALVFSHWTSISKAINCTFQLNNFYKNAIIQPKVFLQYDSMSSPQNWIWKWHWDEAVDGDPPFPAQEPPPVWCSPGAERGRWGAAWPSCLVCCCCGARGATVAIFVDHY